MKDQQHPPDAAWPAGWFTETEPPEAEAPVGPAADPEASAWESIKRVLMSLYTGYK